MPSSETTPELSRRIARHYTEAFRRIGANAPEGMHASGEGWDRIVSRLGHFIANCAVLQSGSDSEATGEAIRPLVTPEFPSSALFEENEVSDEVSSTLTANGFRLIGTILLMAAQIGKLKKTGLPEGFVFDRLEEREFEKWGRAMDAGFGLPEGFGAICAGAAKGLGDSGDAAVQLFAAKKDGEILAVSLLLLYDDLAGVYCVATRPEARGKGVGSHMTAEPLRLASQWGYKTGVLQSSQSGHSVYLRLGFEDRGAIPVFMRDPLREPPMA
jgi:GNAT superfamily N-acetyltransferase